MVAPSVPPAADTPPAPDPAPAADGPRATSGPVVALTVNDSLLHIAPVAEVLDHLTEEAGSPEAVDPGVWEFFTKDGTVLTLGADPGTGALTLTAAAEAAPPSDLDRQLVLDRIDAFLARVQVKQTRNLVRGEEADHRRVPRLTGDLPDVVVGLAAVLTVSADPDPHSTNWVHNLGHRIGF